MKRIIKLVFFIVIICLITFLVFGIASKTHKSKIYRERIKTLPAFSFKALNDTIFCSDQIKEGPVLILYFHPECEHCQYEIKTLFSYKDEISDILILMISNAERGAIRNFLDENNLRNWPGAITLVDEAYRFKDYFGTEVVPATFIYSNKLKLVKYFKGEVKPETILKYLKQDD